MRFVVVDAGVGFWQGGRGRLGVGNRVCFKMVERAGWIVLAHGVFVCRFVILLKLPDFCVNETAEVGLADEAGEVGGREGRRDCGKLLDAHAVEDSEREVECANVEGSKWAEDGVWG